MFQLLTDLILAHNRGETSEPHGVCPPHLCAGTWKYVCECGTTWKHRADAVWLDQDWRAPRRECVSCHTWVDGHRTEP